MEAHDSNRTVTRLGGQALYFLAGNIFTLGVGFPLQVFVARKLGAEDLGVFSLFDGAATLGANLLSFGVAPTLVKFIPHGLARQDYDGVRLLVQRGLQLLILAGGLAVLGVWMLQLLQVPVPFLRSQPEVGTLMALMVPLSLLGYFFQQGLRGFQEVRYMVMGTSFLQLSVKALLALLLLELDFGLLGYVAAVVGANVVSCLWLARGLRHSLQQLPPSTQSLAPLPIRPEWRSYAWVFYLDALLGLASVHLDRFLLGWHAGAAAVGALMLVKQLNAMPGVFFQMFMAIASPMFSAAHARDDARERQHLYHLIIDWVMRLSFPLCLFLLLFTEPLLRMFGADFEQHGTMALRILVFAQVINLALGPLGIMLTLSGSEKIFIKLMVVEQLVSLVGLVVMVPRYGIEGAAMVLAFITLEQNLIQFVLARRRLGIHWRDRRFLRWVWPGLATVATAGLIRVLVGSGLGVTGLVAVLLVSYGVFFALSLLQGLHEDDRTLVAFVVRKLTNDQ